MGFSKNRINFFDVVGLYIELKEEQIVIGNW
ncbi:hypothetical protein CCACVL1_17339 [Corchorus capsularis]|uniref:Uncharacterized protein n=1 Tax=Corchorus capsularis TaxID=210143 RepID=A0A1R3HSK6_COCAP|nr:hypothetical protein CCACVL1_17339 [Corchorus capsularis]